MVVYILSGCMQSVVMKTNAFWRNLSVQDCILERETNPNFVCSSLCVIVICEYSMHSQIVRFSHLLHLLYEFYDAVRDTRWFPHTVCVSSDPGSCVQGASHCRKTILQVVSRLALYRECSYHCRLRVGGFSLSDLKFSSNSLSF
ncbi:hypothetical protein Hanom_Chr02g00105751 [Helianthus anomalus]